MVDQATTEEESFVALPPKPRVHWLDVLFGALLLVVLVVAGWLRFDARNWDDYTHLHPDERFLTSVVSVLNTGLSFTDATSEERAAHLARCELSNPAEYETQVINGEEVQTLEHQAGFGGYFDADCSPLNPNNVGQGLYVYGEFPLFTVHAAGTARSQISRDYHAFLEAFDPSAAAEHTVTTYWEGYSGVQLIGRSISALADWLTVIVLFLLGRRLYGRWIGLLAAGFYAVAALPLQQSHFWTVDAFTTLWVTLALLFAVRAMDGVSARRGPLPLLYLAVWMGGVMWETGYNELPILGLAMLTVLFLATLVVTMAARWVLRVSWGDVLVTAAGLIAAVIYLVIWSILVVVEPDFALDEEMIALGLAALVFGIAVLIIFMVASIARRHTLGLDSRADANTLVIGAIGITIIGLAAGVLVGGLAPWGALLVVAGCVALLIFDVTELTDYAVFGVLLGASVASRINIVPLAGMIVLAAGVRVLPAFDSRLDRTQRNRIIAYAMTGVVAAALMSFIVFRLLQPHAFVGPGIFGLKINPSWREDASESAYMTSGDWDAPPNHQWADRPVYFFAWRNIVLWGMGIPLGLVAWIAWAWAAISILRARRGATRHVLLVVWVLLIFGWLGGRWVASMRYFLPIYPALVLLAAWLLAGLVQCAWQVVAEGRARGVVRRVPRVAFGGAVALLVFVIGFTTVYGFGMHNIHRQQLTRVAASRWFQEFVPGDFGIWVEGDDGTRQMVNIGRTLVTAAPSVYHLEANDTVEFSFVLQSEADLHQITFNRVSDPARDAEQETLRVRLYAADASLSRRLLYEDHVTADFSTGDGPYGARYVLQPESPVNLPYQPAADEVMGTTFYLEVTAAGGGPIMFIRDVVDGADMVLTDIGVTLDLLPSHTPSVVDLYFDAQPLLTGHGDDIPSTPTHWTVGGADMVQFAVPIDGEISQIEIPHLGDPLRDDDAETVQFRLVGPGGTETTATITADFNEGADPLGPSQVVTFDPPLHVSRYDANGSQQMVTLVVEAEDPIYTAGPVVAWEGDWDDPIPWPVCPLPDDMVYADDLPSGLSDYTCISMNMYNGYYHSLKLWMVAEDNDQKLQAMSNATDQADYLVITSNRFYDSLSRIPWRFPASLAYYDALFDGSLGFELVKVFESPPSIGPFRIDDQVLPIDDLPDILNEHWEAEEAFHVYDHPAVLVFRKTDAYSSENLQAILDGVSIRNVNSVIGGAFADPNPVGVVVWGAKEASQSPTLIELPEEKWEIQTDGGTWSDLFDTGSILNRNQVVLVIVWWLLMVLMGWVAWPLLYVMFPMLPDRAFPVAKITGWLLIAWVAWVGGTFDVLTWTRAGLVVLTVGLVLLSALVAWPRRRELWYYVRVNRRHLLAMEGLTLALFLAFLAVRQGNPDLWHSSFGGEKPMDFAYFNAVLRSTVFPPIDPWYAGGYMNYYYFGYVIVGAPVKLLGVQPSLAYNLIIPTVYAMTGIGVFSIAYNWVRSRCVEPGAIDNATQNSPESREFDGEDDEAPAPGRTERRLPLGNPWLAGVLALLMAVVLGNLGTLHTIVTNVAQMRDDDGNKRWEQPLLYSQVRLQDAEARRPELYEDFYADELDEFIDDHNRQPSDSDEVLAITRRAQERTDEYINDYAEHPPLLSLWNYELSNLRDQIGAFFAGLSDVMDGKQLEMHTHRWYWQPTRIISELPNGAGHNAIAEMPYFTFLYGDLHAHMLAFPITLLVLLWLTGEIIGAGRGLRRPWEAALALALGGLAVGVLRPTNSWDWITYLLLGGAGLTYVTWVGAVRANRDAPPSEAAQSLLEWLRPSRVRELWIFALGIPVGLVARLAFYLVRELQAEQQSTRALQPGETLIDPTLTVGSAIMWAIGAVVLFVVVYVMVVIVLKARVNRPILVGWLARVGGFLVISFVAALPFTMYFATAYNSVSPWESETTPLWAYLYVHGLFIFIVISFLMWQTARVLRRIPVRALQGWAVPVLSVLGVVLLVVLGSVVYGVREVPVAQLVVPLIVWAMLLFFAPDQHPLLRAMYALIVLALTITLGVELVVLDGDIGRQNTVFKFYLQVWFMLSVTGGVALAWMLRSSYRWNLSLRTAWQTMLALLFTIALFYPVLATQARFLDRFNKDDTPLTLDGLEYMKHAVHGESGVYFDLANDYRMIRWFQEEVEGTPVIIEALQYPSEYHWNARISINTGLPTILGWNFHQRQQHSLRDMDKLVQTRANNIAAFYEMTDLEGIHAAMGLINHYDIEYIVVGALEAAYYGDIERDLETGLLTHGHSKGLAKFDDMVEMGVLEVVYEHPYCLDTGITDAEECPAVSIYSDRIYHVVPGATLP